MSTFPELLEELREARCISKKEMATRAGLSSGYISLLTGGKRTTPSEEVVHALAEALELDKKTREELFIAAGYPATAAYIVSEKSQEAFTTQDWGEAPRIQVFYGRADEAEILQKWLTIDQCQMIAVVGMGGVGKTVFAAQVVQTLENTFDYILWRSLQNAPKIEKILKDAIHLFSGRQAKASIALAELADNVDEQIALLIEYLQKKRCLLVLDNVETLMRDGSQSGDYKAGYEKYGVLFQRVGEIQHKSCLLLTSREKPKEMLRLEGKHSHVRSMLLPGVAQIDARAILQEKNLIGTDEEWEQLIHLYSGNPLALKLVAESIQVIFGTIADFLKEKEPVFGSIHDLLNEQFTRLSSLEVEIMYWLAIEREDLPLDDLMSDLVSPITKRELFEAMESLSRRSMIEKRRSTFFTLQPVIMEYVTDRLVEEVTRELYSEKGLLTLFASHALIKAQAKDYIRDIQTNLILKPIAERLLTTSERSGSEKKLRKILDLLHTRPQSPVMSYAAGNLLNLLVYLNINLQGYDFSHLSVRQAYLQGVSLSDVNFAYADLSQSIFSDTFGSIFSVALSPKEHLLAAGTANGEIRVWNTLTSTPMQPLQGHTEWVRSVAFSPDGQHIASGSEDQTVRVWNVFSGKCLDVLRGHTSRIYAVTYSLDGKSLASSSDDQTIRLWDVETGKQLRVLEGHAERVYAVAFSPDGQYIVSGSWDQTVRLWDAHTGESIRVLYGHTNRVRSVAFSPDSTIIASGSADETVRLWDIRSGECTKVLIGHSNWVWAIAFSPDGKRLASGSDDQTIRLWNTNSGICEKILQRDKKDIGDAHYGNRVYSLAFGADNSVIASGCDGQTIRLWDAQTGECLKTLRGYGDRIYSIALSPDDTTLASGSEDRTIRLWDTKSNTCFKTINAHNHWVWSVAFSPNGTMLASASENKTVRLWNAYNGDYLHTLYGHDNRVYAVAFSLDSMLLASCSGDQTVKLWDVRSGTCLKTLTGHTGRIYCIAFSPDGKTLVSGGDDQIVILWDVDSGTQQKILDCDIDRIRSIAFSPDGEIIAGGSEGSTIKLWNAHTGECFKTLKGHTNWVWSVAFSKDGHVFASGSEDHTIKLWNIETGMCLHTLHEHNGTVYSVAISRDETWVAGSSNNGTVTLWNTTTGSEIQTLRSRLYERMNILGVQGLPPGQKTILRSLGAIEQALEDRALVEET